jgi:hypothetical protein
MKKIAAVTAALIALVAFAAPAQASSGYTTKQKNRYWNIVKAKADDAYIIGKSSTVEFGVAVCDLLRSGGTLADLVELTYDSEDFYLIEDYVTIAIAAAPVVLCRDQQYKFE